MSNFLHLYLKHTPYLSYPRIFFVRACFVFQFPKMFNLLVENWFVWSVYCCCIMTFVLAFIIHTS